MSYHVIFCFEENNSRALDDLFKFFLKVEVDKRDNSFSHYLQFLEAIQKLNRKYVPVRIPVRRDGITELVDVPDILYLEVSHRTILIHCIREELETTGNLTSYEEQLGPCGFLRIHRRYLISTSHIRTITSTDIILDNGTSLPIGKTYRQEVKSTLKKLFMQPAK